MGMLKEPAKWVKALRLPPGFSVCELGDQWLTFTDPHILSAEWFKGLGCGRYVSIDGNGRGTFTADLNEPVTGLGTFDLVTDFGTGEHIFNQYQVWKTLHDLCRVGGFIAFDRPIEGYPAHCYYLSDPGLFSDIAEANHYLVRRLDQRVMTRGKLMRGVFQKVKAESFRVPQQGRYQKILKVAGYGQKVAT